jgi:hypothetical protein
METKTANAHVDSEPARVSDEDMKNSTTNDTHDMLRMGKTQETRRNFRSVTILGFCLVILSIWETMLATSVFALLNGGTAGLIWGYLIVMIGFGFVTASLAEMASMQVFSCLTTCMRADCWMTGHPRQAHSITGYQSLHHLVARGFSVIWLGGWESWGGRLVQRPCRISQASRFKALFY